MCVCVGGGYFLVFQIYEGKGMAFSENAGTKQQKHIKETK